MMRLSFQPSVRSLGLLQPQVRFSGKPNYPGFRMQDIETIQTVLRGFDYGPPFQEMLDLASGFSVSAGGNQLVFSPFFDRRGDRTQGLCVELGVSACKQLLAQPQLTERYTFRVACGEELGYFPKLPTDAYNTHVFLLAWPKAHNEAMSTYFAKTRLFDRTLKAIPPEVLVIDPSYGTVWMGVDDTANYRVDTISAFEDAQRDTQEPFRLDYDAATGVSGDIIVGFVSDVMGNTAFEKDTRLLLLYFQLHADKPPTAHFRTKQRNQPIQEADTLSSTFFHNNKALKGFVEKSLQDLNDVRLGCEGEPAE